MSDQLHGRPLTALCRDLRSLLEHDACLFGAETNQLFARGGLHGCALQRALADEVRFVLADGPGEPGVVGRHGAVGILSNNDVALFRAQHMHGFGTETMHVLRAEKGYIIVGQDTDGTVTPDDAGLTWAIGKNKADFVGKRSLQRASMQAATRKQLVGLRTKEAGIVLEEGAQVAAQRGQRPPMQLIGHVTSSYASSVLGHSIALGMVEGGRARLGQTLFVPMPDGELEVEVTAPVFYDPAGARINV